MKSKCEGLGCPLRESCKYYLEDREFATMVSLYSPSHGCINYRKVKLTPTIKEAQYGAGISRPRA